MLLKQLAIRRLCAGAGCRVAAFRASKALRTYEDLFFGREIIAFGRDRICYRDSVLSFLMSRIK